jgi:hypothetical protein
MRKYILFDSSAGDDMEVLDSVSSSVMINRSITTESTAIYMEVQ